MKKRGNKFDIKLVEKVLEQVSDNKGLSVGDVLRGMEHTDEYYYDKQSGDFEADKAFFSTVAMKRFV